MGVRFEQGGQKTQFADQLQEGERFDDVFLVKECRLSETRAGKSYLILTVMDKSGEISGPIWDQVDDVLPHCQQGKFVRIVGVVQSYRDQKQLKIDRVEPRNQQDVNVSDFIVASSQDLGKMADELLRLVATVDNPFLKKLLHQFFKKEECWSRFRVAPAAKGIHHAYLGGLLEHALSVGKLADALAFHYKGVDRSLLITGALLHDIGKLEELEMNLGVVAYTDQGRLKGHLVIGSEMVAKAAEKIKDFPEELLQQVQHLILSHHGKMEFGSPAVPMTVESFILSQIDDLDAKMNLMEQLRVKMESTDMEWTDYQRTLERYLFLGGYSEDEETEIDVPQSKQQTLF